MSNKLKMGVLASMILLLIGGFSLILITTGHQQKSFSPSFSTYYTDEFGTHALYRLLDAEGMKVEKNYYSLDRLNDFGVKNYVMIGVPDPLIYTEKDQILAEVEAGGYLVYCPTFINPFLGDIGIHLTNFADSSVGYRTGEMEIHTAIPDRMFEHVDSLAYLRRETIADFGIRTINGKFNYGFTSDSLPLVPLLEGGGKILAGWVEYGDGKILLLSNPYIFTNEGLNQADNAKFAVALFRRIQSEHRGTFVFDEFHHGFRMEKIATPLNEPEVRYMVWGLLLTFVLAVFSFGLRTMKPIPVLKEPRRTMTEFISSVARLYQRKKAQSQIVQEIFHRFRSRIYAVLGISQQAQKLTLSEIEAIAERKWGQEEGQELLNILHTMEDLKEKKGKKSVALVRRIREFSLRNKLDVHV